MNKENTERLIREFPNLYSDCDKPVNESLMAFGFETGDGWFQLIYDLSAKLERLIVSWKKGHADDPTFERNWPRASQVKEKYGTLRFYMSWGTDEMYDLIDHAEERSSHICEECGKPGECNEEGWIRCRCEDCRK